MSCIIEIAINCPLRQTFDYLSDEPARVWQTGMRAKVSFANKDVIGIVTAIKTTDEQDRKLKPIIERLDDTACLDKELFDLILWLSRYYHHPIGDCFATALPKKIRQGESLQTNQQTVWQVVNHSSVKLSQKQQQILEALQQYPNGLSENVLKNKLGSVKSSLKGLEEKSLVTSFQQTDVEMTHEITEKSWPLNDDQLQICQNIGQKIDQFQPFLLHGITGSGKTEVYLTLAREQIKQSKQVLILIPEISLSGQFVARFKAGLTGRVVLSHSAINDTQRKQAWCLANSGEVDVIIGTRSAVFMPLKRPGLLIIDEEHDSAYKQQDGLRYHARNILLMRAKNLNIPIVLGSATPSLESLHQVKLGKYQLLELKKRAGNAALPNVSLIDLSLEPQAVISQALQQKIQQHLQKQQQVLLFINRRGFAPVLMCHSCQWQAQCKSCDAKMVVHQQRQQLFCHHCGLIQRLPTQCPSCNAEDLNTYGAGTEKIEQLLQKLFSDTQVLRIDRDTTQSVNAFDNLFQPIRDGESAILVGTQMLAKGHDFHKVTLVGILDADQGLFSADFRASEYLAQSIVQVTGRAGRGEVQGEVLIQTRQISHPFWQQVLAQDYGKLAEDLLNERISMQLPPASFWAIWRAESPFAEQAISLLQEISDQLGQPSHVQIMGPVPALMEKRAGRYRAQLVFCSQSRNALHRLIDVAMENISRSKLARKVRWSLDIDPIELL
ncbi:MAG TPA: primosomal protein N' [Methylophaga sp.]|nr:primosomal protein N' [Methylophaga sp.]